MSQMDIWIHGGGRMGGEWKREVVGGEIESEREEGGGGEGKGEGQRHYQFTQILFSSSLRQLVCFNLHENTSLPILPLSSSHLLSSLHLQSEKTSLLFLSLIHQ